MAEVNNRDLLIEAFNAALNIYKELELVKDIPEAERIYPVIIGGFAVLLYGGPRLDTPDVDLALPEALQYPFQLGVKKRWKDGDSHFGKEDQRDPNKSGGYIYKSGGRSVGYDWLPIGGEFVHAPLATQQPLGQGNGLVADVPDLAIMKAKSLYDQKRTPTQHANDMIDLKFLLGKMKTDGRQFQDQVQTYRRGYFYLIKAVRKDKEAEALFDALWPVPKAERDRKYENDSFRWFAPTQ
jgi:hypothetical protein